MVNFPTTFITETMVNGPEPRSYREIAAAAVQLTHASLPESSPRFRQREELLDQFANFCRIRAGRIASPDPHGNYSPSQLVDYFSAQLGALPAVVRHAALERGADLRPFSVAVLAAAPVGPLNSSYSLKRCTGCALIQIADERGDIEIAASEPFSKEQKLTLLTANAARSCLGNIVSFAFVCGAIGSLTFGGPVYSRDRLQLELQSLLTNGADEPTSSKSSAASAIKTRMLELAHNIRLDGPTDVQVSSADGSGWAVDSGFVTQPGRRVRFEVTQDKQGQFAVALK